jgi:hypothetical protein
MKAQPGPWGVDLSTESAAPFRPIEMIDQRYDLSVWWGTQQATDFLNHFRNVVKENIDVQGLTASVGTLPIPIGSTAQYLDKRSNADLLSYYQESLARAETFYVVDEFVQLALGASRQLPDDDSGFDPAATRLPAEAGFLYLQRPITMLDTNSETCNIYAMQWTQTVLHDDLEDGGKRERPGIFLTLYTSKRDPKIKAAVERKDGKVALQFSGTDFILFHMHAILTGEKIHEFSEAEQAALAEAASVVKDSSKEFVRFVYSLFQIMDQTLHLRSTLDPTRAQRRRWKKRPPEPIAIIRLRRAEYAHIAPHEEGGTVEWTHQWLVRGHWRTLKRDTPEQRVVYVSPHVKGPPDKPLIVKDHVNVLNR